MYAMKTPNIKKNPNALEYRLCSICGAIIADTYCAVSDKNLCKVCAGEICIKHEMTKPKKINGKYFCPKCNSFIKNKSAHTKWVNEHIKVDEAKIIYP